ncbi:HSP20-like chaperone [Jimgerdemannia flammicorona]|uniref:HSP20-like chaperone n=1 Tax=Jimgerdemannia flammicorona TaxID=994334 RepID=A0A433B9S5_9FUNG|nr:HSP20-like chaperone [Jimgerdemannia flammicorona]
MWWMDVKGVSGFNHVQVQCAATPMFRIRRMVTCPLHHPINQPYPPRTTILHAFRLTYKPTPGPIFIPYKHPQHPQHLQTNQLHNPHLNYPYEPLNMSLVSHDPEFFRLEDNLNRIFNDVFQGLSINPRPTTLARGSAPGTTGSWVPTVDVTETDKEYVVHTELPGVPKENVKIDLRDNRLVISGEHEQQKECKEGSARIRERRFGSFSRTIPLPRNVKADEVQAKFDQGVLEVHLPKSEHNEGKSITVQ